MRLSGCCYNFLYGVKRAHCARVSSFAAQGSSGLGTVTWPRAAADMKSRTRAGA
jgi:hypothetical protein